MITTRNHLFAYLILPIMLLSSCTGTSSLTSSSASSSTNGSSEGNNLSAENFITPDNEMNATKLVTYDGPELLTTSSKISMTVEEHPIFVYETRVNHARSFTFSYSTDTAPVAIFDFEGRVHVSITVNDVTTLASAVVRPLIYGITPEISGNVLTFALDYSGNYTVEYNDDYKTAIHIFANAIEANPIDPENIPEGTIYLGPGIYDAGAIPVTNNSTVYIAGGAVVFGQVRAEGMNNLTIRGRGIISGQLYDRTSENQFTIPIELRSCTNVLIEGITFLDPAGWTMAIYKSSDVTLDNVKIITARANGDGVSVQSCTNFLMKGGFVRSWDDSLVVKNVDRGNTSNVTFDGVTVWTDLAQSMEVGYETYGATMDSITFKNIIVLHNFHKAAMSIHNCDDALITNVLYQNITIEDGQMLGDDQTDGENDFLIDIVIAYNIEWTKSAGLRGNVDGVTFDNIKVNNLADTIISRINGESVESSVKNVTFKDMNIEGTGIQNATQLGLVTNDFVSGVSFSYDSASVRGAVITLPYKLVLSVTDVNYTNVPAVAQEGLLVPDFAWLTGPLSYAGIAATGTFSVAASHGVGNVSTTPVDDGTGVNSVEGFPGANVTDSDRTTTWKSKPWTGAANEFAGLTIEFDVLKYVGQIRILGLEDNPFSYDTDMQVWGKKLKTDGSVSDKYVRILSSKTYSLTPQSGNCIDINVTAQEYKGLQLRIFPTAGFTAEPYVQLAEVYFYSPSLTFNKPVVDGTTHADVYPLSKLTDGQTGGTSYYESLELPAFAVIDMQDVYAIQYIVLSLPPSLLWDPRTQNIAILTSADNAAYSATTTAFVTTVPATDYLFDPINGNLVAISLPSPVNARYIKLMFASNSAVGGYGAQLSEVSVYGS